MTPEGKVKERIKKILKSYDAYYEMPVPGGFGKSGLDFNVCMNGYWLSIEAKAPGKLPTARQLNTMRDIAKAGGAVIVVHDEASFQAFEAWLKVMQPIGAKESVQETMKLRKDIHLRKQRSEYDKKQNEKKH